MLKGQAKSCAATQKFRKQKENPVKLAVQMYLGEDLGVRGRRNRTRVECVTEEKRNRVEFMRDITSGFICCHVVLFCFFGGFILGFRSFISVVFEKKRCFCLFFSRVEINRGKYVQPREVFLEQNVCGVCSESFKTFFVFVDKEHARLACKFHECREESSAWNEKKRLK